MDTPSMGKTKVKQEEHRKHAEEAFEPYAERALEKMAMSERRRAYRKAMRLRSGDKKW